MTGLPLAISFVSAQNEQVIDLPPIQKSLKGHSKLESVLHQLATAEQANVAAAAATTFAHQRGIDLVSGLVKVIIEAVPGEADAVRKASLALGAEIDAIYGNLVRVLAPISKLIDLANNPAVRFVRLPRKPVPHVISEGVGLINADGWQSAGFTGSGVRVGILDVEFSGYTSLLGTELPPSVTTQWYGSGGTPGTGVHGTACAEIIYDIAPDAEFYLTNIDDDLDWGIAVDWLIAQGVDVISTSLGWSVWGPGDGTGFINDKVADARTAGILWVNSAGNYALGHWMGGWADNDGNDWLDFVPGIDETNHIYATAGDPIFVTLKWDDPWGLPANDYDLYVLDDSLDPLNPVAFSWNDQAGGYPDPIEEIGIDAPYTGFYYIAINMWDADGTSTFHLFTKNQALEHSYAQSSLGVPADSPDAMTVGAVYWDTPGALESFSSQGPTGDGRTKPDLVSPDGVVTASYGGGGFYGTSAAAPHAAGAAALVKDANPGYTPAEIQAFLEGRAIDLGIPGKDNLYGSGRLNLGAVPDAIPPTVVSTSPGNGATGVPVTTVVSATFNEAIDEGRQVFILDSVAGTVTYDAGSYTATFTPDANLAYSAPYTSSVSASDLAGNPMAAPYIWGFTTEAEPALTATTINATNITADSATLNGTLDDLGNATSVQVSFEWGLNASYGNETFTQTMTTTGPFNAEIVGLSGNTTYYFRAKVVGDGIAYGADVEFTTPPQLPCRFHGTVQVDGADVADGTVITATIEGYEYSTTTPSVYGNSTYQLEIAPPADVTYSEGTVLTFKMGDQNAHQTGFWVKGGNIELDLTAASIIPGDANGDGVVNAIDITKTERIIAGLDAATPGADANQDGDINALDITKTERIIAGWTKPSSSRYQAMPTGMKR